LLLPAVQAARDSARRTTCANNLRQISTAFQLHHDTFGYLPSGGTGVDTPRTLTASGQIERGVNQAWGWAYQVLPYLEQSALYDEQDDAAVKEKGIETYFCPSRRGVTVFDVAAGKSKGLRAQIDYAGNGGTDDHGKDGMLVRSTFTDGKTGEVVKGVPVRLPGSVPDGTSNTLLLGERWMNPTWYDMATGPESDDYRGGFITGMPGRLRFVVRSGSFEPAKDRTYETFDDYSRFGSAHAGSFNAVMADGSQRVIRYSVSPEVFRKACRRNDGEAYDLSQL
jgi:hypothetical protein